jgi:RimJ/RimL family protein N-acetyltransferase
VTALPADPWIAGEGVRLRRWDDGDVAPLTEMWQDAELRRRFAVATTTRASVEVFVRDAGRDWESGTAAMLAIVDAATDDLLGGCDLSGLAGDGPADVGYWVAATRRGQGIAPRAARSLVEWATDELGLTTFVLEIEPDNAASIAVARRLGFTPDGTERVDPSTTPARTLVRHRLDRRP